MEKAEQNKIQQAFKESFDENVQYSGFDVSFSEVDENAKNASFSGTYQFALMGATSAQCLKSLGAVAGEPFLVEDDENTIEVYFADEESSVVSFDGSQTIYFSETDEDDAEEMGKSLARSLNAVINKVIDESKKIRSNDALPFGIKTIK